MNTSEKIADINAMIDYVTAMSMRYGERISIASVPPKGDDDRFTHVSIGFGRSGLDISGFGDNLLARWTSPDGEIQRANLQELQEAAGGSKA